MDPRKTDPLKFEFLAVSEGKNEPVEFYYGADERLEVLQQRLRTSYPSSFDIDRVQVDPVRKILKPVGYRPEEVPDRLEQGRFYDSEAVVAHANQDGPIGADGGTIYARPTLDDITPYGVRWRGSVDRRKDWMTTLTDFSETIGRTHKGEDARSGRAPLAPLIDLLTKAAHPLAYQVVFQGRSDWSRDARRRAGELLDGTDTLLQKLLSLESPGSRRRHSSRRNPQGETRHTSSRSTRGRTRSSTSDGPSRPTNVEGASRFEQVRQNSPKRTFSVNLQLLTLAVDGDEPEDLAAILDPMRSVFDLVDGQFYEIDGRRLRSRGYLPGSGERHARAVLDRFVSRSMATGGRRVSITNRSETRPDLILNGDKLANFLVIPSAADIPTPDSRDERASESEADEHPEKTTTDPARPSREAPAGGADGASFSTVPETVVHRDAEIKRFQMSSSPSSTGSDPTPSS